MNVEVDVSDRVMRPVSEVFEAVVDPAKMSRFFITKGSGPMQAGTTVQWTFADVGRSLSVDVREVDPERRIVFDWTASGVEARVSMRFEGADGDTTRISIREAGWPMDGEGVQRALQQTRGWVDFLCCMKAYLQYGVNLRLGRTQEDYGSNH